MKKDKLSSWVLVLFVLTLFGAGSTFSEYAEPTPLAYTLFIVPLVFGLLLIKLRSDVRKERQAAAVAAEVPPLQPAKVRVIRSVFPVAGVTFDNDDGTSRQEILQEICEGELDGIDENCWLNPYLYNGEMALGVMTSFGCVGNIRHNDVDTVLERIKTSKTGARLQAELFETDDGREIYRADVAFAD